MLKLPEKREKLSCPAAGAANSLLKAGVSADTSVPRTLSLDEVLGKEPHFTDAQWLLTYLLFATQDGQRTILQRDLSAFCRLHGQLTLKQQNGLSSRMRIFRKHDYINKDNANQITLLPEGSKVIHRVLEKHFGSFIVK